MINQKRIPHPKLRKKTTKTVHGVYKGIPYIAYYHQIVEEQRGRKRKSGVAFYCGYVRLPDNHPYQIFMKKLRWHDLGLSVWKQEKKEAEKKGELFTKPKPKSNRWYIHNGYEEIPIQVHGELTFSKIVGKKDVIRVADRQGFAEGSWIGWDYGHGTDQICDLEALEELKLTDPDLYKIESDLFLSMRRISNIFGEEPHRWTKEEVVKECKNVINQLIKAQIKASVERY